MRPLLFELDAAPGLADRLNAHLGADRGALARRQFPDGETYLRLETPVEGRDVILLCTLDRPDAKTLPLLFAAEAARDHGAKSVGLIAPYLAYMRQDEEFQAGEAVTSKTFARLLSGQVDWLVTIDPHLHRYPTLGALYPIPAEAAHAAGPLAEWIRHEVPEPVIVGPDEESAQWADEIASLAGARAMVLRKVRSGDYDVSIDAAGLGDLSGTPVIIDDIASSGRTLIETVELLRKAGAAAPICAVVHPIFAGDSYSELLGAGAARIVSTNSIAHDTNAIDVSGPLADAARTVLTRIGAILPHGRQLTPEARAQGGPE